MSDQSTTLAVPSLPNSAHSFSVDSNAPSTNNLMTMNNINNNNNNNNNNTESSSTFTRSDPDFSRYQYVSNGSGASCGGGGNNATSNGFSSLLHSNNRSFGSQQSAEQQQQQQVVMLAANNFNTGSSNSHDNSSGLLIKTPNSNQTPNSHSMNQQNANGLFPRDVYNSANDMMHQQQNTQQFHQRNGSTPPQSHPLSNTSGLHLSSGAQAHVSNPATRHKFKTDLCRNWEQTGGCNYRQCTFAHGQEELRHYIALAQQQQQQFGGASAGGSQGQQTPGIENHSFSYNPLQGQQQSSISPNPNGTSPSQQVGGGNSGALPSLPVPASQQQQQRDQQNTNSNNNNNNNTNSPGATNTAPHSLNQAHVGPSASVVVMNNIDRLLVELTYEIKREKDAFSKVVDQNKNLERELQSLQTEHNKDKQQLAQLKEKASSLRTQTETVPRPSFMVSQS